MFLQYVREYNVSDKTCVIESMTTDDGVTEVAKHGTTRAAAVFPDDAVIIRTIIIIIAIVVIFIIIAIIRYIVRGRRRKRNKMNGYSTTVQDTHTLHVSHCYYCPQTGYTSHFANIFCRECLTMLFKHYPIYLTCVCTPPCKVATDRSVTEE